MQNQKLMLFYDKEIEESPYFEQYREARALSLKVLAWTIIALAIAAVVYGIAAGN
jgi:hypothetical protein